MLSGWKCPQGLQGPDIDNPVDLVVHLLRQGLHELGASKATRPGPVVGCRARGLSGPASEYELLCHSMQGSGIANKRVLCSSVVMQPGTQEGGLSSSRADHTCNKF